MDRDCKFILLISLAALVMTLPTLGVRDITTSHEGRVAQTARQMAVAGWPWDAASVSVPAVGWRPQADGTKRLLPDPSLPPLVVNPWIVPVISGEIRLQKPPLPYWATAGCFKLFGVNEWSARLVPTLMWVVLTWIVADLARILIHPRMAVWAAGIWISSYFGFDEFRKCMADPYIAFFAIAAVWAWGRHCGFRMSDFALQKQSSKRFLILFYSCVGLGFLTKGPAIFVPILAGMLAAWSLQRPGLWRKNAIAHLFGFAIFLFLSLPWYAVILHRVPNALLLWKYESLGGFGEKNEKPQPFWFYLPQLLLISLPWTPLWIAGIAVSLRKRWRRAVTLLWQGLIVVVFSLITQKKNAYLLPALAAQTMLATEGIRWLLASAHRNHSLRLVQRVTAGAIAILAVAVATAFPLVSHFSENLRSAKAVGRELTGRQMVSSRHVPIDLESLPPDAAFYLPLLSGDPSWSFSHYVVVDDRRNAVDETSSMFHSLTGGREVISVSRVMLKSSPKDFRWKVFEVTVPK